MTVIPAIDIKGGKCVRLVKGRDGTETVFSDDPVSVARRWEACGAQLLHLVDLDGAFRGEPVSSRLIADVISAVSCPVQVGGGIRSLGAAQMYFSLGAGTVIIGTAALEDSDFLGRICADFPGRVAVSLDTRASMAAVKGWTEDSAVTVREAAEMLRGSGVSRIIRTDIERDGTLSGVDLKRLADFLSVCDMPVAASGGVSSERDIESLIQFEDKGLWGVIVGRAIYSGAIDLARAIRRFS